jgi:hypothetical protein
MNEPSESNQSPPNEQAKTGNTPSSSAPGGRNPRISSAAWQDASGSPLTSTMSLVALERCCAYRNTGHLFAVPITIACEMTSVGADNKACSLLLGLIGSKLHSDLSRPSKNGHMLVASLVFFGIGLTGIATVILANV